VILLDTNVLSELMKPKPDRGVVAWIARQPSPRLFTTSITEAEILYGIQLLTPGKRRRAFEVAAMGMFQEDFDGRILPFDSDARLFLTRGSRPSGARWDDRSLTSTPRSPPSQAPGSRLSPRAT